MKSTGIIRRIDELGRIVIPKEIRRGLFIRDGENIEIFVEDEKIILKKYSRLENLLSLLSKLATNISNTINCQVLITDREKVVISQNNSNDLSKLMLSSLIVQMIDNRTTHFSKEKENLTINDKYTLSGFFAIVPMINSDDCLGLIIIYNEQNINSSMIDFANYIALAVKSQIDIA